MERYFMFLGRKNQYCKNDYTTKCNLQIQCYPYQITKEEVKLSVVADDMIPYIDDTKDATRKLLKLISESSKVAKLIHRNPIQ